MIIYLHGFASSGNSTKVDLLKQRFGTDQVMAPDLPFDPIEVSAIIAKLVTKFYEESSDNDKLIFVGTSLGAFYANFFGQLYDCPIVLINPSVFPDKSLRERLGLNHNHVTKEEFLVSITHLNDLETMRDYIYKNYSGRLINLFLAKDDEVIPYETSLLVYGHPSSVTVTDDGGHRYDKNWNLVLDKIEEILKN